MAALREPETGCPWDIEQTFKTIVPYTIEEVYEVDRTRHAARFLEVSDQEKLHREISAIHTVLVGGGELDPYPALTEGVRAEVRAGPFKGVQGLVEGRAKLNRIVFQIEILGQASSLEIDGSLLEVLG